MPTTTVRTTYLELTDPAAIVPARRPRVAASLHKVGRPAPELSRYLYSSVGGHWHWRDRLSWTYHDWLAYLDRRGFETWYLTVDAVPAGYFELDGSFPPDVEIPAFGLIPTFTGQGLGGWLLEMALRRATSIGSRVWLHTCTLDSPVALDNYRARGLVPFRVDEHETEVAAEPPGPWPGAGWHAGETQ